MNIQEVLQKVSRIQYLHPEIVVESTAANELKVHAGGTPEPVCAKDDPASGTITVGVLTPEEAKSRGLNPGDLQEWRYIRVSEDKGIELYASHTWFLYRHVCQLIEDWSDEPTTSFSEGKFLKAAFKNLRPAYDSFLNIHARTTECFNP